MLKFYHAPWSRSSAVFWLIEELGVDYEMELVDIRGEGGAPEEYRAVQPNKKVPAIEHEGKVVTERAAIAIYLGDAFPRTGLAPAIGDPDRAAYLSMLVYHDAVFDPAICGHVHGLSYVSNDYPFGLYDDLVANLEHRLSEKPYAAGDRFTIADVILGSGMNYTMNVLKGLPQKPAFEDYVARVTDRPAYKRSAEKDAALAAKVPAFQAMFASRD
ncbi:glutathione S-transferase family protein [Chelativorans sp. AA-79]|uniref:glutathione S-transferase family protein n=1 Tax=Chelativorans sp. AA-79 TaxID=3028735 RepID=UPI0023F6B684|nr:glutathione S-transferase family protein [Chelativorans sp. AA-79]WEX07099.1 glutathione S-transferase family protein [Chelativorans sp. AA-79]